jgi:hypothetical protein
MIGLRRARRAVFLARGLAGFRGVRAAFFILEVYVPRPGEPACYSF